MRAGGLRRRSPVRRGAGRRGLLLGGLGALLFDRRSRLRRGDGRWPRGDGLRGLPGNDSRWPRGTGLGRLRGGAGGRSGGGRLSLGRRRLLVAGSRLARTGRRLLVASFRPRGRHRGPFEAGGRLLHGRTLARRGWCFAVDGGSLDANGRLAVGGGSGLLDANGRLAVGGGSGLLDANGRLAVRRRHGWWRGVAGGRVGRARCRRRGGRPSAVSPAPRAWARGGILTACVDFRGPHIDHSALPSQLSRGGCAVRPSGLGGPLCPLHNRTLCNPSPTSLATADRSVHPPRPPSRWTALARGPVPGHVNTSRPASFGKWPGLASPTRVRAHRGSALAATAASPGHSRDTPVHGPRKPGHGKPRANGIPPTSRRPYHGVAHPWSCQEIKWTAEGGSAA